MCGIQLKDSKRVKYFVMLTLHETIDQLSVAKCVLVWPCVEEGIRS